MSRIGRRRRPDIVFILTLVTGSLFMIIWICIVLEELRKFRNKGANGYVIGALILALSGVSIYVMTFNFDLAGIVIIIGLIIFVIPLFFYVSRCIDKEFNKLSVKKDDWANAAFIPLLGVILLIPAISDFDVYLLVFSVILLASWVFVMQKVLNSIWQLADKSQTMALPVMASVEDVLEYESENYD